MAILNHGSTIRTADGGQSTTTIVTASNIGTYGIAANSPYFIGTTQNIFNRASGAQTLTGVSIDGNAANITAYTINQNVGTGNAPSFTGMTSTAMLVASTSMNSVDDWQNSPISIRERGLVAAAQSANTYSPNLNFHWASRISNSLWMDANGNLSWGSYDGTGVPSSDGAFYANNLYASIYFDKNNTVYYLDAANSGTSLLVAGNVGIGTTSANNKLTIQEVGTDGTPLIRLVTTSAPNTFSWFMSAMNSSLTAGKNYIGLIGQAESQNNSAYIGFNFQGAGSTSNFLTFGFYQNDNLLNLRASGNVGIGTTSPSNPLHINTSANEGILVQGSTAGSWMNFKSSTSNLLSIGADGTLGLGFYNRTSSTYLAIISNSGSLGIGTTSPSQKLHVVGTGFASTDFRAPIFYDSNDTNYYGDFASTSKQYQAILFGDSSRYSAVSATINGAGAGDKLILYGNASNYDARVLVGEDYDFIFKSQGSPSNKGMFRFYSGNSATLALEISATQNTTSTGDFRAPIFYDSNNTAYYLDPNNTGTSLNTAGAVVAGTYVYSTTYLQAGNNNIYPNGFANTLILNAGNSAGNNWIAGISIAQGGNVGIGTTSPSVKLAVDGEASFGDGSKLTMIGLDINSGVTPNFIKIRTKIPFASGAADFTINIKGFRYGSVETTSLMVCWHYYLSTFYNPTISSAGSFAPTVKLSAEDWDSSGTPKVCIVLVSPGYWPKLYVESMYSSAYNDAYADGWDWVDADATGTGNNLAILTYKSNFGNSFVMLSDGNVGIGTISPSQKLHVVGTGFASTDFRAPIFYDSDNTAYYINPASNSIVNSLTFDSNITIYKHNDRNLLIQGGGGTDAGLLGRGSSGQFAFQVYGSGSGSYGFLDGAWAGWDIRKVVDGDLFLNDNNTYYLNPGSTTNLNNLTVAGTMTFGTLAYTTGSRRSKNSSNVNVETVTGLVSPTGPTFLEIRGFCPTTMYRTTGDRPAPYGLGFGNGSESGGIMPIGAGDNLQEIMLYGANSGPTTFTFKRQIWEGTAQDPDGSNYYGSAVFSINTGTGAVTASTDIRAPIFYDSANTAYYCDPNGVSNLYGVAIRGDAGITNTDNQIFFWGTGNTTTSAIGFKANGNAFPNPTGAGDGYNTYLTMDTDGRGWVFRRGTGGTDFTAAYTSGWILNNGIWQANASMRSPIFYDSNDTNYYGDFASTSRLNILNLVSYGYINGQTLNGQSFFQWEGATFRNPADHTPQLLIRKDNSTTGINGFAPALALYNNNGADQTTVGMAFVSAEAVSPTQGNSVELAGIIAKKESSGTAGGWSQGSLNFFVKDFGTRRDVMSMSPSGVVTAFVDVRAPIFYDSNNTAFYCDPTATSNFTGLTVANTITGSVSGNAGGSSTFVASLGSGLNYDIDRTTKRSGLSHYSGYSTGTNRPTTYDYTLQVTDGNKGWEISMDWIATTGPAIYTRSLRDCCQNWSSWVRILDSANYSFAANMNQNVRTTDNVAFANVTGAIFYDAANTAYYIDAASTSNLVGLTVANTITGSVSGNAGTATILQTARNINGTSFNGSAAITTATWGTARTLTIGSTGKSVDGSAGVSWSLAEIGAAATNQTMFIGTTSVAINRASASQTLTGVSIDGSSASCTGNSATTTLATKATRANGNFYIDDNYGNTVVGLYSPTRLQGVFAMGDSYKLTADGTGVGTLYGLAWSHPNFGGVAANLADHGLLILQNGVFKGAWGGGSLRTPGDVRGTLFYDWDNTAYYCDPASTSNLNAITAAGNITAAQYYTGGWFRNSVSGNGLYNESTGQHFYSDSINYWNVASSAATQGIRFRTGGHNGTVRGYIIADTNNDVGLLNQDGNWRLRIVGGDYALFDGSSVRAQIFYDSNDTNYYINPASNSVLNGLYANSYNNLVNNFKDVYVYGDVNTYYIVLIQGEYIYSFGRYSVTRGYNWTGPDTWNTASHKGGLTLDWEWSGDTAWGGNDKAIRIIEFNESYSNMVAGLGYPVNGGVIIWLRGGGVNGAQYRIRTPIGSNSTVTVYDGVTATNHSSSTSFTAADSTVFSTRANTNNVSAEISARYPVRGAALLYNENNAVLDQGGTSQTKSGILSSAASLRAPIFYDTDNTGYYLDPNSTTSLRTVGSWRSDSSSWDGEFSGKIQYHSNHWYFQAAGSWLFRNSAGSNVAEIDNSGNINGVGGFLSGNLQIRNSDPTITFRDTDHRTAFVHVNSNIFYVLTGGTDVAKGSWSQVANGRWPMELNLSNNNATFGGDVNAITLTAPIFYDSNDTAYYLDPAGTSNLNKLSAFTMSYNDMNSMHVNSPYVARYNGSALYRNGTMGYGTVDCNVIFSNWGSGFIDTWGSPANAPGGSTHYVGLQGFHYNHQDNSQAYGFQMLCAGEANNRFFWRSAWPTLRSWVEMIHSGNYNSFAPTLTGTGASGSWGISITGNSATVTNGVYTNTTNSLTGVNYFRSDKGSTSTVGANSNYALQAFSNDAGAAGMSFHRGGYYAVNMGLDPDNILRIGGWSAAADRWQLDMSGNNWVASSFRAPIFYDSNDTTYYVDPASTSNLVGLTVANTITGSITGNAGGSSASCTGNSATATTATNAGCVTSDTGNVGDSRLQYWQTSGNTTLNPDTEWYNAIRMGHGNPVTYYSNTLAVKMTGSNLGDIYTRTTTNGTAGTWNRFWNNNNDGAGSGLDADLLDGINSASFLRSDVSATNSVDLRSPIFYDSNNTAYYVDPSSTSNLVGLTVANTITGSITGNAGGSSASCSGNAATATILQTARTIGGVSFNGSANINLPGVNTAGNQNTTGTAANVTGTVAIANGGTGATTAAAARSNLGIPAAETSSNQSLSGSTTCTIDVAAANVHILALASGTTISSFTYNNRSASPLVNTILVVLKFAGTATVTWSNVVWSNGTTPTLTGVNGKADVYSLTSYKGGTTGPAWIGSVVGQNMDSTNL